MEQTTALALPDEGQFKADIQAINRFQQVVRANMVDGQDYGVIPGTQKPTLLKPGAEKIAKLLGLADHYFIEDKAEDWQTGFFRYLIKCQLVSVNTGIVISEGLGECNSMESKYRWRWVSERDLPQGIDKASLISQARTSKTGGRWTVYRLENEDIYSQVNTILKMSKKRALVDAALSAGRLSQVFTQDIEDMAVIHDEPKPPVSKVKKEVKDEVSEKLNIEQAEQDIKDYWTEDPIHAKEVSQSTAEPIPEPDELQKSKRDPDTIKSFNDLYRACSEDFTVLGKDEKPQKMQPYQVIVELGVGSQSDISDTPADCYRRISAVR